MGSGQRLPRWGDVLGQRPYRSSPHVGELSARDVARSVEASRGEIELPDVTLVEVDFRISLLGDDLIEVHAAQAGSHRRQMTYD